MRRFLFLSLAALAAFCSSASASTLYGTNANGSILKGPEMCTIQPGNTFQTCTLIPLTGGLSDVNPGGLTITETGVLTRWTIRLDSAGSAAVTITPRTFNFSVPGGVSSQFTGAGVGIPRPIPQGGGTLSFPERLPVVPMQRFGIDISVVGAPGDSPQMIVPFAINSSYGQRNPALPADGTVSWGVVPPNGEKFIAGAVVEADADGDGYGDESQDGCPQRADVHADCPPPAISSARVSKTRKLTFFSDLPGTGTAFVTKKQSAQLAGKKQAASAKTIYKSIKTFGFTAVAGKNTIDLKQRVGSRRLTPGTYRVELQIVSAENTVGKKTLSFTIKKPKKKR